MTKPRRIIASRERGLVNPVSIPLLSPETLHTILWQEASRVLGENHVDLPITLCVVHRPSSAIDLGHVLGGEQSR